MVTNPFSITYGSVVVGGASETLLLHGPYIIDKGYSSLRLVFDVVVVATSYATLQTLSESVEAGFIKRDQNLTISLSGNDWVYVTGVSALNVTSTCQKSGDPQTDRGYSRAYTCVIQGELPASDNDGLRDLQVNVDYASGRQKTVTMRGVYTATAASTKASARYQADFDAEASTLLTGIDSGAVWELVDETYDTDRNDHTAQFTRQYSELLAAQSQAATDDADIRDHRIVFTDLSQHPGDSQENIQRLRRVVGNYDCSIDIDQTTDMQTVFADKVRPHVIALFELNFSPVVFGIEDERVSYDETSKRMSVAVQMLYQKSGGENVVEVAQSVTIRESRQIDYTYVHSRNEFGAYADPGWALKERIFARTSIVIGSETPKERLSGRPKSGEAGLISGFSGEAGVDSGIGGVNRTGWNTISSTSQVTPRWIGDPASGQQIEMSILTEQVVERWNEAP